MKARVGFIGLGDQGAPMAAAIAERHHLIAWARRDSSYESLSGVAFDRAADPKELAESVEFLCFCLPGDAELEAYIFGGEVIEALSNGGVVINHATGDPLSAARMGQDLHARGVGFLDAPVSGGRHGAATKNLTCFVGGEAATLERAQAVLECHSSSIVLMGEAGAGQTAKLLNNALTISNLRNAIEVLNLAKAAGIDLLCLQHALATSSGGSFILQALGRQIQASNAEHIAQLNRKDVQEFADAMHSLGLDAKTIVSWAMAAPDQLPDLIGKLG